MDFLSIHEWQIGKVEPGRLGPIYSYRRATMGSTRVARRAGSQQRH